MILSVPYVAIGVPLAAKRSNAGGLPVSLTHGGGRMLNDAPVSTKKHLPVHQSFTYSKGTGTLLFAGELAFTCPRGTRFPSTDTVNGTA